MPSEEKEDKGTHGQALEESWLGLPVLDGAASVGKQREVDSGSRKRVYVFPKPLFMCRNHSRAGYSPCGRTVDSAQGHTLGDDRVRCPGGRSQRTLAHFSPLLAYRTLLNRLRQAINTKETD